MGQKIALVLSGGGAKGYAHIGVIETLIKHGFEITSIAGTSIGSVIGGIYAMNKLPEFTEWILKLRKKDIFNLLDFSLNKSGLLKGEKIFKKMKTFIPEMLIEDFDIPYKAVATDILNEKEIIYDKGCIYEAIRASVSIPNIFIPIKHEKTLLVDGGVLNPVPINVVERTDDDILVVVNLYSRDKMKNRKRMLIKEKTNKKKEKKNKWRLFKTEKRTFKSILKKDKQSTGYLKILELTSDAFVNQIAEMTIDKYNPDILINIPADVANLFDFNKAAYLINFGKKEAEKSIQKYLENKKT
ncbi:MAG: patatin-like phospholipase family protein [Bacteroidota bacterium]|nr:patatin-like phospholipase family protein [Bacteroidota bacterium]